MSDRPDRMEREIEELLRKIDDFPTEAARIRAQRKKAARGPSLRDRIAARLSGVTISQLMLAGIVMVLASYFVVDRIQPTVGKFSIIAGLILFFSSFILSVVPAGSPQQERRWRGRIIDTGPEQTGWRARLRAWRSRRR